MREKTGYYDRNGKEIRDGDKIKVRYGEEILIGHVEPFVRDGEWCLIHPTWAINLKAMDDIEILEDKS